MYEEKINPASVRLRKLAMVSIRSIVFTVILHYFRRIKYYV